MSKNLFSGYPQLISIDILLLLLMATHLLINLFKAYTLHTITILNIFINSVFHRFLFTQAIAWTSPASSYGINPSYIKPGDGLTKYEDFMKQKSRYELYRLVTSY